MITYTDNILAEYPAFKYVAARPQVDYSKGADDFGNTTRVIHVHHGDEFAATIRGHFKQFSFGSVTGYAVENCACPFESYERSVERGHKQYWVNAQCVVITAHKRDQKTFPVIELGTIVKFEGKYFELVAAPNDNINLKQVEI